MCLNPSKKTQILNDPRHKRMTPSTIAFYNQTQEVPRVKSNQLNIAYTKRKIRFNRYLISEELALLSKLFFVSSVDFEYK